MIPEDTAEEDETVVHNQALADQEATRDVTVTAVQAIETNLANRPVSPNQAGKDSLLTQDHLLFRAKDPFPATVLIQSYFEFGQCTSAYIQRLIFNIIQRG